MEKGLSSFGMHDSEQVFKHLKINQGNTFLDLGCGAGDYSLYAANQVGKSGHVYAFDLCDEILENLKKEATNAGINSIHAMTADIFAPLAIKSKSVDVCMLATVLHSENVLENAHILFNEIKRVLKPKGRLSIIECKKEEMPFGPPLKFRVSPDDLEKALLKYGFKKMDYLDLGYNYMVLFEC
ncbi:MAG: methyltransferase domain-containing protein [Marinilabiliaceae bacterium]|nr:methyltransferase domain-containing protein [Marinilabiliaceae bacterium]